MSNPSVEQAVQLDLRYEQEVIATYEFSNFADANSFLVRAKGLADQLVDSGICTVKVTISQVETEVSDIGEEPNAFKSAMI